MRNSLVPCLVMVCLCLLPAPTRGAGADTLSPGARLDLAVLATAYPGVIAAIELDPAGKICVVLNDGAHLPYDDGLAKTPQEALDHPDVKDMLGQPYTLGPIAAEPAPHFSPGRRRVQAFFMDLYGHDRAEAVAGATSQPFLGRAMAVPAHYGAAPAFARVSAALAALLARNPGLARSLRPVSGGVYWRAIAGTNRLSMHAFGAAVDMNPNGNPYWRDLPPGKNMLSVRQAFPQAVVDAFEQNGFIWGGKWAEFDLMHFEYRPEILLKAKIQAGTPEPLTDIAPLVRPVARACP